MPKVRQVRLPEEYTVDKALRESTTDLLPSHMAAAESAKWIINFSDLFATRPRFDRERRPRERERWREEMHAQLARELLEQRVDFYFASLFHIGRMFVTASAALTRIESLEHGESLEKSTRNIELVLKDSGRESRVNSIRESLMESCGIGRAFQGQQRKLAEEWWQQWECEVTRLQSSAERFSETLRDCGGRRGFGRLNACLLDLWQRSSVQVLQDDMIRSGVKFKNLNLQHHGTGSTTFGNSQLFPFVLIALSGDDMHPEPWYEVRHMMERWLDADRDRVNEQRSEIYLDQLKAKYGTSDPFDRYRHITAPTQELAELIKEHKLPNNMDSPWLASWKTTLVSFSSYNHPLLGIVGDTELESWCVTTADSTIAENLTSSYQLPWSQLLQNIFESKWVVDIAKMAVNANKKNSNEQLWDASSLFQLVSHTVTALNQEGYELNTIPENRLANLIGMIERGESVWSSTEW